MADSETKYQINSIDGQLGHAEVTFFADDGTQFTEVMGDLPLADAEATKQELSRRLFAWQDLLHTNEKSSKADPVVANVDPDLESILLKPQDPEDVAPLADDFTPATGVGVSSDSAQNTNIEQ